MSLRCVPPPSLPNNIPSILHAQRTIAVTMQVSVKCFDEKECVIEVGVDDTTETMRQKVATAAGLAEDSFHMGFGGKQEGEDITQLSAGDTVVLTKTKKYEALAELHALGETDITAERLVTVEDPVVACLLLQAEVATVIPKFFFFCSALTTLDLSAVSCVTEIGDDFLMDCTSLTRIDLSGLSKLRQVGYDFLNNCTMLTTLDLAPLGSLMHVASGFLFNCANLTELALPPLLRITHITDQFLYNCHSLTALDLSAFVYVKHIGCNFLSYCKSIERLDLSPFRSVLHVDKHFLHCCEALATLDLSPLRSVTALGSHFAVGCTSLKSIALSGCSSVVSHDVRNGPLKELVVDDP